jgi:ABC-2 type transport system permease protein
MMPNIPFESLLKDSRSQRARRLAALIVKEFWQIIRDPSSLLISVVLPLLLLFLYGFGVSLDLNHLRIGLVLEDTAPDARSFAEALTASKYFDVTLARDRRELFYPLEAGKVRGIVVIPSYFSAFRHKPGGVAPIQVIADGSEPNTANFVQNYVQGAYQVWLQQQVLTQDLKGLPLVSLVSRFWYNEELESRFFLMPGSLAIIMTLIGTLLTALVVAREWERGTMESLMATPVTIGELMLGKLIPYFILGMLSMTICVVICVYGYGLPLRGSVWVLYLVTAVFLFCALGFGLMISTLAKNQIVASQAAIVSAFLPSYMLSGFIFEISSMPKVIQWITYIIPAKYFVTCLQTLFLVGNVWSLIFWNMIPMLALGIVYYLITAHKTVKRLD